MGHSHQDETMVLENEENRPKRRQDCKQARPASQQQQRPASAIMASIMGVDQNGRRANSQVRSDSATSASGGGRQHKLKQRFTVIRKLGKGTYGKVQLAINKETGQEVAIKTIKKTKIENEQDLERVRREIQIMSSIEHPHIIHIYEVFENKDKIVLIMQYAPGGELYEYVSSSKVLDEHEARRLFRQIATAIYYCHQNKICHRDLKLENILLDEKNNAKLADFGLSNVFDKSRQLKTFCGSPLYASPEIVQGSPYEGPEVDCWSLGVLLYTLVYGAMPFDGSNFKRLVKQISEASYYEPKQRSDASPLIGKLLCADPLRRATVLDICSDPWVNGLVTTQRQGSPLARLSPTSMGGGSGSQHPSLLKVAQDMANLTPVRLDILLALTPQATSGQVNSTQASQQNVCDPHTKLADDNQRQIIQPSREHGNQQKPPTAAAADKMEQHRQQQEQREQEKQIAIINQLGSDLMDATADETRSTSPVASYIVRDLSPIPTQNASQITEPNDSHELTQASDKKEEEKRPTIEEEIELLEATVTNFDQNNQETAMDVKMTEDELAQDNEIRADLADTSENQIAQGEEQVQVAPVEQPMTDVSTKEDEKENDATESVIEAANELQANIAGQQQEAAMEVDVQAEPAPEPACEQKIELSEEPAQMEEVKKEMPPESAEEPLINQTETEQQQVIADNSKEQEAEAKQAEQTDGAQEKVAGEESKPKKLKKRIVVVKKRRKVVKKDENNNGNEEQKSEQPDGSATKSGDEQVDSQNSNKRVKSSGSTSGPGKVRIPETFTADEQAANQAAQPKQSATRRTSALISDVSQKLLMQQQQSQASTTAIEQDQTQLASVRVSDKRDEFERRSSLAVQQSTLATPSSSPRESRRPSNSAELEVDFSEQQSQPESCESRRESVRLSSDEQPPAAAAVEQVKRLAPLSLDQLKILPVESGSEPLTPTNTTQQLRFQSEDVTAKRLGECAERLSNGEGPEHGTRNQGDRSDSVETIKADGTPPSPLQEDHNDETPPSKRNIRSSLQIDLKGLDQVEAVPCNQETAISGDTSESSTSGWPPATSSQTSSARGPGPAPITRSYKKVTFTKDGTCITETGRIYSTQADDGTMRRVERKSKVTHYPSDDFAGAGSSSSGAKEETSTHEEIVYESTGGGGTCRSHDDQENAFWPGSRSSLHAAATARPLERLIMPSSSFFRRGLDEGGQEFLYDDDNSLGRSEEQQMRAQPAMQRADSASSCSSGSTDVFDDIFDTWTGAISMFNQRRHLSELRNSTLMNRAFVTGSPLPFGRQSSALTSRNLANRRQRQQQQQQPQQQPYDWQDSRPQSSAGDSARFFQTRPGSASIGGGDRRQRCESVEPPASLFAESQAPTTRERHRRHQARHHARAGDFSAGIPLPHFRDGGGYDSDAPPPFDRSSDFFGARPQTGGLGSARGRFGSSNLFPRHADRPASSFFDERPFFGADRADEQPVSLFEQMELEHERLRQRFAQQRKQMWKGSTPTLNAESIIPDFQVRSNPMQQQQQPMKRTSVVLQMGGGSAGQLNQQLRQSTPLDNAPVRRNTANLSGEHLPPRKPTAAAAAEQLVRRSTSKTSFITNQLADLALGSDNNQTANQQQKSASFIGITRNTSGSSSSLARPPVGQKQAHPLEGSSGAAPACPAANTTATTGTPAVSSTGPPELGGCLSQRDAEANSRIQSWLLQSAGNLSISSGSKSSTSDATLPSSSGRSEAAGTWHVTSSPAPLRRDESIRTTTSTSLSIDPQHQHQRTCSSSVATQSRTILSPGHGLPPPSSRSPSASSQPRVRSPNIIGQQQQQAHTTLIVRSSSKKSLSELLQQPTGGTCHQVTRANELTESSTIMSNDGLLQQEIVEARQKTATTSSSAVISADKMFSFPSDKNAAAAARVHQETVTSTSSRQVFSQRIMSPMITTTSGGDGQDAWFAREDQRPVAAEDDFDSGGLDLESCCSSSLLEQLRARGYRSMINQRMEDAPPQAVVQTATSSGQTTTASSNVVTSSSTSFTMSTSTASDALSQIKTQQTKGHQDQPNQEQSNWPVDTSNPSIESKQPSQDQVRQEETSQPESTDAPAATAQDVTQVEQKQQQPDCENDDEDQDEDVREAKANIKEYLERMRETENFLKSMHEEEERFQRQRQELFMFNNLLLSTKLNGIKHQVSGSYVPNGDHTLNYAHSSNANLSSYSAPVCASAGNQFISTSSLHLNGGFNLRGGPTTTSPNIELSPQISCFSSDIYKPITSSSPALGVATRAPLNPLEPVQPLSLHSYAPVTARRSTATNWHRSKSQLGSDRPEYPTGSEWEYSRGSTSHRPLSANIDAATSSSANAYFPSRQRRSMSQVRYPHHHNNPSALASAFSPKNHLRLGGDDDDDEPAAMMSEYKSSFGPPRLAMGARTSRSPRRATSPLPAVRARAIRARGSHLGGGSSLTVRSELSDSQKELRNKENEKDDGNDDDDDDDLGLRSYRVSSYVPRGAREGVARETEEGVSTRAKREYSSRRASSPSRSNLYAGSEAQQRRSSVFGRTTNGLNGKELLQHDQREDSVPAESSTRRKSWTSSSTTCDTIPNVTNSRLSELEQRIEANKRRREELLMGINNTTAASASSSKAHKCNGATDNDDDDDPDQSFGFERPSRQATATSAASARDNSSSTADARAGSSFLAMSSPRARPSRLESMEARIKRRSYCIKLSSPDRTAAARTTAAPLSRRSAPEAGTTSNKCQMEEGQQQPPRKKSFDLREQSEKE